MSRHKYCIVIITYHIYIVPAPEVSLSSAPTPLIAGTPLTLICTIILDTIIDINVVVDIVSEILTDGGSIINTYNMSSGFIVQPLVIPVLSITYTSVTCAATVRQLVIDPLILTSSQSVALVNTSIEGEYICTINYNLCIAIL